ncbi:hypothetical protein KCU81_g521, partial [Aureobasidium melanogenum]
MIASRMLLCVAPVVACWSRHWGERCFVGRPCHDPGADGGSLADPAIQEVEIEIIQLKVGIRTKIEDISWGPGP